MTLGDTKPGDSVISNAWNGMQWAGEDIPRQLIVIKRDGDCVWCKPADGLTTLEIPLYHELVCRRVP
jgi:hypothetical protein